MSKQPAGTAVMQGPLSEGQILQAQAVLRVDLPLKISSSRKI
jgi:hypothetical protein